MASIDPVVIVTGGARGIGLACSRRFYKDGYRVVIADIDEAAGQSVREEIIANGGQAVFVRVDVAEKLDIHNLIAVTLEEFDRIDVLINNAEVGITKDFLDLKALADIGYNPPDKWLPPIIARLQTETGKILAEKIMNTEWDAWWLKNCIDRNDGKK